jgi:Mg-chelatase subunit ChlD
LKATQSVVYLLDCSGSMGEFGKLDLARAALLATLEQQPADVRFQVIFYNSAVWRLLPGGLISVGAIRAAELKLATIEASGRSNHLEALRAAVALQTDAIVWLTDAGDLSAQKCKLVASEGAKPIRIYVAEVSARGVAAPRELR